MTEYSHQHRPVRTAARLMAWLFVFAAMIGVLPSPTTLLGVDLPQYRRTVVKERYTGQEALSLLASLPTSPVAKRLLQRATRVRGAHVLNVTRVRRVLRPQHRASTFAAAWESMFGAAVVEARDGCDEWLYPASASPKSTPALVLRVALRDDCEDVDEVDFYQYGEETGWFESEGIYLEHSVEVVTTFGSESVTIGGDVTGEFIEDNGEVVEDPQSPLLMHPAHLLEPCSEGDLFHGVSCSDVDGIEDVLYGGFMHDVVKESVFALLPSAAACVLATGVKNMQTFLLCVGGLTALFSAMGLAEDIGYEAMHYLFDCVLDVIDAPQPTESTAVSSPFAPTVPWGLKSLPVSFKPDSRGAL